MLKESQHLKLERRMLYHPHVLIVDDDIDSALATEIVFLHLGCQTTCILNWNEARRKICAMKPDIIVLDWMLDPQVNAGHVIKYCSETFAKFDGKRNVRAQRRPQIITYSSLNRSEIKLPQTPYFDHLDHWQKPLPQREVMLRALGHLNHMHR